MILHQKVIANKLELGVSKVLSLYGFHVSNFISNGVDIYIKDLDLYIEVKSSFRYCKNNRKYDRQNFRFSSYSFKHNELFGCQEFYIFIEKVNTINDFHFIKKLIIFVIKTSILKEYMSSKSMNFCNRIQISINEIKKLPKYSINEFIDLIKNE